jgi:hypothetical protein
LRDLDGNGFRQAQDATYALSDDLRDFAARDPSVPSVRGVKFYKQIDTVVCLYPTIQPGSRVEKYPYVSLLGYDQLLDRLVLPGPCLPWSDGVWDAFVRHLGLYRPNERSADDRERDAERAIVEDYRRRFVSAHAAELHELVPVAAVVDGRRVSQPDIAALAAAQQAVLVLGPSGIGKTHLAEHAALDLARQDHVTL